MGTKLPLYDPWSAEYPNLVSGCCPRSNETTRSSATYAQRLSARLIRLPAKPGVSSLGIPVRQRGEP
jgi:hypothetical protein